MERVIFTNANLLDGEHAARPRSTVVVDGERISGVGGGGVEGPGPTTASSTSAGGRSCPG